MSLSKKSHIQVTDEWLHKYMPVVDEAIIQRLESTVDYGCSTSRRFERKMRVLIRREKYGFLVPITSAWRRAAVVFVGLLSVLSLAVVATRVYHINAAPSYTTVLKEWGRYLSSSDYDTEIYVQGKNVQLTSTDVEQAAFFYTLNGMNEEDALQNAIMYMAEREVLYLQALSNGYGVTDEEIWKYLDELKVIIASADNKEDAQTIISQFESEEAYWEYEFQVYKKNLPIQNYVLDLEKNFVEEYGSGEGWLEYFEEYKQDLVEAEKLRIVR